MKKTISINYFTFQLESQSTKANGYLKEIEELGKQLESELEKLDYDITLPSFTDWGYTFDAEKKGKNHSVIIEVEDLEKSKFKLTIEPNKKMFQFNFNSEKSIYELLQKIKKLNLGMEF